MANVIKQNIRVLIFFVCIILGSMLMNLALTIPRAEAAAKDDVTLKEYFEARINSLEENIGIKFENIDGGINGINERLDRLTLEISKLSTKSDTENNRSNIQDLRESRANQEGKASMNSVYISYAFTASLGIGIFVWGLKKKSVK